MVSTFFILVVLCKGSYHNQWWVRNGIKFSIILHSSRTQKHNIKQVLIDRQASMVQAARNVKRKLLLVITAIPPHLQRACNARVKATYHVLARIEEVDTSDLRTSVTTMCSYL